MKFSKREIKDLWIAGLVISLAFAILLSGGYKAIISFNSVILIAFFVAFFTAGIGFLLHELMHKYVAQSYGLFAEFKAYYQMLLFTTFLSFFGFIIAAPGAVYIQGRITKEKNGKISLAGPITNIVLALIFLVFILAFRTDGILEYFLNFGLTINALLAAFNMIPVMPFDGAKILDWNKVIYAITAAVAVGLFIIGYFI